MSDEFFWDGYVHWARILERSRLISGQYDHGDLGGLHLALYEPLFIQPKVKVTAGRAGEILTSLGDRGDNRTTLQRILATPEFSFLGRFVFSLEDFVIGLEHLVQQGTKAPKEGLMPEFFIFRRLVHTKAEQLEQERLFQVIDVGAPAYVVQQDNLQKDVSREYVSPKVIGAVIDNDIGFLNRRFRREEGRRTRFTSLWLQARERLVPAVQAGEEARLSNMVMGHVIGDGQINDYLADTSLDERSVYLTINRDLHRFEPFRRFPPIDAHGSAVTDLAFGAEPGEMDDVPLLAVQLPPEAAYDTSGTYSESYIVQGFRWLCWKARQIGREAALVVNISYGALAGQKDGGKFLESQIRREVELASLYGQDVHVVYAFDNSLNSRQVARISVAARKSATPLVWRIPPNNPVPSFAEIRAMSCDPDGRCRLIAPPRQLRVEVVSPAADFGINATVDPGEAVPPLSGEFDAKPVRLFRQVEHVTSGRPKQTEFLLAGVGPTRQISPEVPVAPAGDWSLVLHNDGHTDVDIVIQIQRGDTAPGFRQGGRQSYFDGQFTAVVADEFVTSDVVPPLTNEGTQSAYTTAAYADRIHTAAALREVYGTPVSTDYSSRGAAWTAVKEPTNAEVVDKFPTRGKPVSGAYSGSRSRLSGTSAAAALVSRRIMTEKAGNIS